MRHGSEFLISSSTANVYSFSKRAPLKAGQETFHCIIKQNKQANAFPTVCIMVQFFKKQAEEVGLWGLWRVCGGLGVLPTFFFFFFFFLIHTYTWPVSAKSSMTIGLLVLESYKEIGQQWNSLPPNLWKELSTCFQTFWKTSKKEHVRALTIFLWSPLKWSWSQTFRACRNLWFSSFKEL